MPNSAGSDLSEDNLYHAAGILETKGSRDLHVLNYLPIPLNFRPQNEDQICSMVSGLRQLVVQRTQVKFGSLSLTSCMTWSKLLSLRASIISYVNGKVILSRNC